MSGKSMRWCIALILAILISPVPSYAQDGGMTWTQTSAGMNLNQPGVLYASSWLSGVFVSTDGAQSWQRLGTCLPFTAARQLALSDDGTVLYIATRGGGHFRLGTP